jgi:hypothetical protein
VKEDRALIDSANTTRRKVLTAMPAVTVAAAFALPTARAMAHNQQPSASHELKALIKVHREAYRTFIELLHRSADKSRPARAADRIEQKALLAICAFPARSERDRQIKARYLLEVEERGELDLPQHMQALLSSMV